MLKTFSCGNCSNNFAHYELVIIPDENHACANQFVVDVKKVYIIKSSENSCRGKIFSCGNCNKNFTH